jgi:glycosyltransferase involved in cell wall biosynthesis
MTAADIRSGHRIRVALITGGLVPGGAERQMLLLAEGLPKDEFSVDFLCIKLAGDYAERARSAGVRVRVLGLKGKRESGWPYPIYVPYLAWTAVRFARMAARYDILDAWLYHAYVLAAATRVFTRATAVIGGRRSLSAFKARFNRFERLGDAIARRAIDVVVANSEAVRTDVLAREHLDPAKLRVIHNGVPAAVALAPAERRALRAAWGADDQTLVIGCVANYKPHKGLELLIRSVARLARTGGGTVRLVLVGEGRLRPELERVRSDLGVEREVVFHGAEPDARRLYGAFDVAALASEAEGLPNVILEAAAAGLPIVATAAGGTVEIITDGVTGRLVEIGDEDALVEALTDLRADPAARRRLGDAARADVEARFGVERMVAEFAELYREQSRRRSARDRGRPR